MLYFLVVTFNFNIEDSMQIKDDVVMAGLKLPMREVLISADKVWRDFGQELVITGALDGTHSAGSLHYYGFALDLRTRYFHDDVEKKMVKKEIQSLLGSDYDVVLHKSHIHVEFDPKGDKNEFME